MLFHNVCFRTIGLGTRWRENAALRITRFETEDRCSAVTAVCRILLLALLTTRVAGAQESLDAIVNRGYVAHWLVCGPFAPDADGGIAAAVTNGKPALGTKDFMEPAGGVPQLRPRHLLEVTMPKGKAIWQQAGTESASLDLSPFFPKEAEGVAYAAFYADVTKERAVYFDLQTPLGARVWINGFPVRDITYSPVVSGGIDRFLVKFRTGKNLVVMEIPGASIAALAGMAKIPEGEFLARGFLNRPLLQGKSGYEIALALKPAESLGEVYYVPRLDNAGTFSGTPGDLRQDTLLTLFNPTPKPQPPVEIAIPTPALEQSIVVKTPSLTPQTEYQARVSVPTEGKSPGQSIPVKVLLATKDFSGNEFAGSFDTSMAIIARTEGGRVYIITGPNYQPDAPEDQPAEQARRNTSFNKQMAIITHDADYGIDLGPAEQWRAVLTAFPQQAEPLTAATRRGRCAAQAGYARPDERLVAGEILARNLVYGLLMSQAVLFDGAQTCYAWNMPGIAPQTPQLLTDAGLSGFISNLEVAGIPELSRQESPDGSTVLHRRKQTSTGPGTIEELRQMVSLQRRELLEQNIKSDVLVLSNRSIPPEPFFLGASEDLARSYPSMLVEGGGGRAFFEDIAALPTDTGDKIPMSARALNTGQPGAVMARPDLKRAHALIESRLLAAEKLASFASLFGAVYPDAAMDHVWRQLLYWSTPERLGVASLPATYVEALAGYHEMAELVDEVTRKSAAYLAREAGTLDAAPSDIQGVGALVVFNTCAWPRTDVCVADLNVDGAPGLTLYNDDGVPKPFAAERLRTSPKGLIQGMRLRFVAEEIPSMGYRTYYLVPRGALPKPAEHQDTQIENDFLLLIADAKNGAISSLTDKKTGVEFADGPLNRVLLLDEDAAQTDSGREVWTTGGKTEPGGPVDIRTEISALAQRLIVTTSLGGGKVIREMTLYQGIPRVECVLRTEGVSLEGKLLAVTFSSPAENRLPLYGERFGAMAGRFSQDSLSIQSKGLDTPSGAAPYPALHWAAVSRGDYIQVGSEDAVMLRPAVIVYGKDRVLEKAARDIQNAFIRRGIPATLCPDQTVKPGFAWTDSTELLTPEADLAHGQVMHIVVGSPEQNRFCQTVLKNVPEETLKEFNTRLQQGAVLLFENKAVPEGSAPVTTLILAGLLMDRTVELSGNFAEAVRIRGTYSLPPAECAVKAGPIPDSGFAVLFPGAQLCNMDQNGTLVVGLAHGAGPSAEDAAWMTPNAKAPQTFAYAMLPFTGDWREGGVAQAGEGYAERLTAAQAGLHAGRQPGRQSLVSLSKPGLIISAVKPLGNPLASRSSRASEPLNGLILRAYEPSGIPWEGDLQFFTLVNDFRNADLLENPRQSYPVTERSAHLQMPGFGIETLFLMPNSRFPHGDRKTLARDADPFGPVHTRYWRHGIGSGPFGGQPLTLLLEGELSENETNIQAVVGNQLTDETIEGMVLLKAAEGWSLGPAQFYYRLKPGQTMAQDILVMNATGDAATGGVAAWTEYGGQVYRDVLERNASPLEMAVSRTESQIKVSIENQSGIAAEGFAELIVPSALWPDLAEFGLGAEVTVFPRRAAVSIPPFKKQDILFRFSDPAAAPWGVVKLAANGHILRQPLPPMP